MNPPRHSVPALLGILVGVLLAACNNGSNSDAVERVPGIVEDADNAVVRIGVNCPPGNIFDCMGTGSGWVYDDDGHIITNNHVVTGGGAFTGGGDVIVTTHDGRNFPAAVVGTDPQTDLAVLQIEETGGLSPLPRASVDETSIGEPVVAIGHALDLGVSPSVTTGVVSAKERRIVEETVSISGAIQTDAAINPGNSGGPLLNMEGEVVGVNTAQIAGAEGIGFAISMETVSTVAAELLEHGEVRRGFVGIAYRDVTPGMAEDLGLAVENGVHIEDVNPGTPADEAGLQQGDVIVEAAGEEITTSSRLPLAIIGHSPGDTFEVTFYRDDEQMTVELELAPLP